MSLEPNAREKTYDVSHGNWLWLPPRGRRSDTCARGTMVPAARVELADRFRQQPQYRAKRAGQRAGGIVGGRDLAAVAREPAVLSATALRFAPLLGFRVVSGGRPQPGGRFLVEQRALTTELERIDREPEHAHHRTARDRHYRHEYPAPHGAGQRGAGSGADRGASVFHTGELSRFQLLRTSALRRVASRLSLLFGGQRRAFRPFRAPDIFRERLWRLPS